MANKSACTVKTAINGVNLLDSHNISRLLFGMDSSFFTGCQLKNKKDNRSHKKFFEEKGIKNANDKH